MIACIFITLDSDTLVEESIVGYQQIQTVSRAVLRNFKNISIFYSKESQPYVNIGQLLI